MELQCSCHSWGSMPFKGLKVEGCNVAEGVSSNAACPSDGSSTKVRASRWQGLVGRALVLPIRELCCMARLLAGCYLQLCQCPLDRSDAPHERF